MTYQMILAMYSDGVAIHSIPFDTEGACEKAKAKVLDEFATRDAKGQKRDTGGVKAVCVAQGEAVKV